MHVGIANPRWRGKRSRHSRCMRNPQFYASGKRSFHSACAYLSMLGLKSIHGSIRGPWTQHGNIRYWYDNVSLWYWSLEKSEPNFPAAMQAIQVKHILTMFFIIVCPIHGFLLQQSVIVSDELINFRYESWQSDEAWPEYINLETFEEKQAPAVLNIVETLFHGVSRLGFINHSVYQRKFVEFN